MNNTERGAYTVHELAARVGCSTKAVRKWAAARRLPGMFRAGRSLRFDAAEVSRRLATGELLLPKGGCW